MTTLNSTYRKMIEDYAKKTGETALSVSGNIACTSLNSQTLPTTNFTPWIQSQRQTFTAAIGQNLTNWDIPNACIPMMCSAHLSNGTEFVPGGNQSIWIGYADSGGTGLRRIKHYADFGSAQSVVAYIAYFTPATAIG